jgi:murein tripeptide amidase MpaA
MSTNFKQLGTKRCISPSQATTLKKKISAYVVARLTSDGVNYTKKQLDDYITKLRGGMTA